MEHDAPCAMWLVPAFLIFWILWRKFSKESQRLSHLPGPIGLPFLGNTFSIAQEKRRLTLHKWAQEYGDVYRVRIPHNELVVSGYKYIHHVLVTQGHVFGARKDYFRIKFFDWDSGFCVFLRLTPVGALYER